MNTIQDKKFMHPYNNFILDIASKVKSQFDGEYEYAPENEYLKSFYRTGTSETGLVFFNPKSGVEIAVGLNNAFPMPNNPWFDVKNSEDDIYNLFFSEQISTELALFCIENGKNKLSFLKDGLGKMYLEDIDFLLRFWKKGNYHARPEITYSGKSW